MSSGGACAGNWTAVFECKSGQRYRAQCWQQVLDEITLAECENEKLSFLAAAWSGILCAGLRVGFLQVFGTRRTCVELVVELVVFYVVLVELVENKDLIQKSL